MADELKLTPDREESVSERELAQDLEGLFGGPRSVGEAVAQTEEQPEITVVDEPVQPDTEEGQEPPPVAADADAEPAEEVVEEDTEEDENLVWAKGRFGEDTEKWAKILRDQDQMISRQGSSLKEAQELAVHYYEQLQEAEGQAYTQGQLGMPLSAQEESWVETVAMQNPQEALRQAAYNNNANLYNAVLARVAEENPALAANLGAQVQIELQQAAQQEQYQQQAAYQPRPLPELLGESVNRLGIDLQANGEAMRQKVGELGVYHPYVQAILNGDDNQRDLGVQAVYDLVRESKLVQRRVRDESREAQIQREGELRKAAAGVVTGSPHTPPADEDPLLAAMTEEWKARRQWGEE